VSRIGKSQEIGHSGLEVWDREVIAKGYRTFLRADENVLKLTFHDIQIYEYTLKPLNYTLQIGELW
jgi:hypothetical protein